MSSSLGGASANDGESSAAGGFPELTATGVHRRCAEGIPEGLSRPRRLRVSSGGQAPRALKLPPGEGTKQRLGWVKP
ncbi:hypothetical protein [Scytonema sp. PCC 10023]|uniref:hypothetical protein n=1 Tax=Scytonema sp. PCC 10023 TaxID=1680591 RepID=UPI0039C65948